jgi:hypothetical protein
MRAVVLIALLCGCRPTPPANANANARSVADQANGPAAQDPFSRTRALRPATRAPRIVSISDLPDLHPPTGVTTAAVGQRRSGGTVELGGGLQLVTRCGSNAAWCVDGLIHDRRTLISPYLSFEELQVYDPGHGGGDAWLERVIRVAAHDDRFVSLYVAESEYSGGAHANNSLTCRSFDAMTGNALALFDVIPYDDAERLLADLRGALADDDADPAYHLYSIPDDGADDRAFLVIDGEVVLCAEGDYPLASSSVLELSLGALPR